MATVPVSALPPIAGAGQAPSDTDTAIAAALLHREGAFNQTDDDDDTKPKPTNVVKMKGRKPRA